MEARAGSATFDVLQDLKYHVQILAAILRVHAAGLFGVTPRAFSDLLKTICFPLHLSSVRPFAQVRSKQPDLSLEPQATNDNMRLLFDFHAADFSLAPLPYQAVKGAKRACASDGCGGLYGFPAWKPYAIITWPFGCDRALISFGIFFGTVIIFWLLAVFGRAQPIFSNI